MNEVPPQSDSEIKSQLVLGGASFSGLSSTEVFRLLDSARALGVCEVDTAPIYGPSEYLIGQYNRTNLGFLINTKVGRKDVGDIKVGSVIEQLDRSMNILNCSVLNNVFIHSIPPEQWREQRALDGLIFARESGLANGIGYSGDNSEIIESESESFDAYMFSYNYLDRSNNSFLESLSPLKNIYLKRVLANAPWKMSASVKLKSFLSLHLLKKQMLDFQSYEFRYSLMKKSGDFRTLNLSNFLNFARAARGSNVKIVVGVRNVNHLEELIKIEKDINLINRYAEFDAWQQLQKQYNWRAIT